MNTRVLLRDLEQTKANLNPGTIVESHGGYELWQGRDILSTAGTYPRLKTNCWVVRCQESGWETYWHGDKTQTRNERNARHHYRLRSGLDTL